MPDAVEIHGTAFKNGSATLLARVVGANGIALVLGDLDSAAYSVYLLDDDDPDSGTAVTGHQNVALNIASIIFDPLQKDALWDVDDIGYNLKHTLDVSEHPAFGIAGRHYRVEFRLVPGSGQVILVRFRVYVI